jgi:phosphoribosylaminoimidazolecarboxamide formyltransferase/IMP cyclohydrolase
VSLADITGFPEMKDGQGKILHPALHGGILARRDRPDDLAALEAGMARPMVDVWCVNLFRSPGGRERRHPVERWSEEIERGAVARARAPRISWAFLVVVDPGDYPRLLDQIGSRSDRGSSVRADAEGLRAHGRVRHDDRDRAAAGPVDGDRVERASLDATSSGRRWSCPTTSNCR